VVFDRPLDEHSLDVSIATAFRGATGADGANATAWSPNIDVADGKPFIQIRVVVQGEAATRVTAALDSLVNRLRALIAGRRDAHAGRSRILTAARRTAAPPPVGDQLLSNTLWAMVSGVSSSAIATVRCTMIAPWSYC
jgi:hypothetical protein